MATTSTSIRLLRMKCMSRHTIHGWSTATPLPPGRDGIRIPESGLAGPISLSESATQSAGTAALDGGGVIGGLTGMATMPSSTMADTTPTAAPFITAAASIAGELDADRRSGPALEQGHSKAIGRRPVDTPLLVVKAAYAPAHLVVTITAESREAIRHAD